MSISLNGRDPTTNTITNAAGARVPRRVDPEQKDEHGRAQVDPPLSVVGKDNPKCGIC